nr:RecName: Full=Snake venom metalloproteinase CatroxMP-II; Short=SVMP; AltName: Full=Fibrinogenolytic metalloproteinase [Crotalus atrox]
NPEHQRYVELFI